MLIAVEVTVFPGGTERLPVEIMIFTGVLTGMSLLPYCSGMMETMGEWLFILGEIFW